MGAEEEREGVWAGFDAREGDVFQPWEGRERALVRTRAGRGRWSAGGGSSKFVG